MVQSSTPNPNVTSEKPYGISNIKASIPIVLDLGKLNYDARRKLFQTHCIGFGLVDHLNAPTIVIEEREMIDSIIQMWMFWTISGPLLQTVLKAKVLKTRPETEPTIQLV